MKRILMVALLSTLAVGSFANIDKPKKHKRCDHCVQKQCTPDCKTKVVAINQTVLKHKMYKPCMN